MKSPHVVLAYKTTYMQRICDYVRLGYRYWTMGAVDADRALRLVRKFEQLYGVGKTRHQRAYAKARGEANAVLLLYAPSTAHDKPSTAEDGPSSAQPRQTTARLWWMLLITPGEHLARQLEALRDATMADGRIELAGYELVLLPRAGLARPAWTWRMTRSTYEGWRTRLVSAARHRVGLVNLELAELARVPGYAGCRNQCRKLVQLARGEATRRMPAGSRLDVPRIRYVQRLANEGTLLPQWTRAHA